MKIVLLHYHLKPGGVTTVIRQQIAALKNDCDILVLTGSPAPPDLDVPHVRIAGLAYDDPAVSAPDCRQTAAEIASAISGRWHDGCDFIHVHNPLLAKNRQLLRILDLLQQRGFCLFLQVHDFAEDGRPLFYYGSQDYPVDCHYGVINSRDYDILKKSGLSEAGLHLLPNMVDPFELSVEGDEEDPSVPEFVLYPVRAIRRKNIGEALLLSLYFAENRSLAITLPPNSPGDWKIYEGWKAFASEYKLNVVFEASRAYDFKKLVHAAFCLLTTSIAEGFGFAFLEPWTAKKVLIGRKLPAVCRDFEKNGIALDHLYDTFRVPLEWIDASAFEAKWRQCFQQTVEIYQGRIDPSTIDDYFTQCIDGETLDFAMLDEPIQKQVICRVIHDAAAHDELKRMNPHVSEMANLPVTKQRILANREAVLGAFSQEAYRHRLLETYDRVKTRAIQQKIDKEQLLRFFLDPQDFGLLKWCNDAV